ncbi:MAG: hypothetical protein QXQ47_02270 [Candidatus Bathyarchaeia archaeon]
MEEKLERVVVPISLKAKAKIYRRRALLLVKEILGEACSNEKR